MSRVTCKDCLYHGSESPRNHQIFFRVLLSSRWRTRPNPLPRVRMLTYSLTREEPVRPRRLRFGLLSASHIRKMSVCEVKDTTLYYRGLPASGGLLDPLMGTVDRRLLCATCLRDARSCPGHPGNLELSYPMFHIGYVDSVLRTLRCTCFFCSRLCATTDELSQTRDLQGKARLLSLHTMVRGRKRCVHCDMVRPTYNRTPLGIKVEWPDNMEWSCDEEKEFCNVPFTAREALSILHHMTDEDITSLGFDLKTSRPEDMILQNLVVPPPIIRPAVYTSEGSRSRGQNDLTVKYLEILKRSQELKTHGIREGGWKEAQLTPDILDRIARVQYEVYTLVNNNIRAAKPPGGRTGGNQNAKSLSDRLRGKEGRVRSNLMGKRVDFSARCVITPDAYFEPDRVGVPYSIAHRLTVPETVNAMNIQDLSKRVKLGSETLKGAENVIYSDGLVVHLGCCKDRENIVLHHGDVVERYLSDDDVVVFNRQPSLHKHGMCAHRVRLMPGSTFRVALPVATPYNADFDGDEMNLHVPQGKAAQAECSMLMAVAQNVIGGQSNKPVLGLVQDTLLGLHLLTLSDVLLDHSHSCRMIACMRHCKRELPRPAITIHNAEGGGGSTRPRRIWTGKQIFSIALPADLHLEGDLPKDSAEWKDAKLPVVVREGRLLCGVVRKAHIGTAAGGIVDLICREYGGAMCIKFLGDAGRLANAYLLQRGHHVGIKDVILHQDGHVQVEERLQKATRLCEEIQKEVTGDTPAHIAQTAEQSILKLLSKTLLQTGGVVNECLPEDNAIRRMVTAGSKGSFINLSQICAALGQQSLEGSRISVDKTCRTLPCFKPNDKSLASRGMVQNSFALGLTPTETFMHAIGGREGLVDTAVKTSQTGYLQRRMNKSMEDARVHTDGTIINAVGEVISFSWGSDGLQPTALERVKLHVLGEANDSIRQRMTEEEASLALKCKYEILRVKGDTLVAEVDLRVLLPFHPQRVKGKIARARDARGNSPNHGTDRETGDDVRGHEPFRRGGVGEVVEFARRCSNVVALAVLDVFCAGAVAGMTTEEYESALSFVKTKVAQARAVPGESVGCIAAQSIGEPCTQLTLNTFHFAGFSGKNVTMGIPRLRELLDAAKSPKTPCTTLKFREPFAYSKEFVQYVSNTLVLTRLEDVVTKCDIVFDPDGKAVEADRWIVQCDELLGNVCQDPSQFVVRLKLARDVMRQRGLTPPQLRHIVGQRLGDRAVVSSSETNAVDSILRIRFAHVREMVTKGNLRKDQEAILCHRAADILLETVLVCGHPDVTATHAMETSKLSLDPNAGVLTTRDEFVVQAYGKFLMDSASLSCVDWERSTSNDIWEVLNTLGIEACVHVLFDQMKQVVSFDGTYIDERHLMVICDTMCRGGYIMPLNRHGINKTDSSPLMRCSFEETIDVLCEAGTFGQSENGRGVSTSIMTGQLAEIGTGVVDAMFHSSCAPMVHDRFEIISAKKNVLRSTCRTHNRVPESVLEYVFEEFPQVPCTTTCTPHEDEPVSKRKKFKPMSPTK